MSVSYMISNTPSHNNYTYNREVRKHSSSNGCMSLLQTVTFPRLTTIIQNWVIFAKHLSVLFGRKDTVLATRESDILSEVPRIIIIYLREIKKHSSSNGCLSLLHSIICSRQIWCPKNSNFCLKFEHFGLVEKTLSSLEGDLIRYQRHLKSSLYI